MSLNNPTLCSDFLDAANTEGTLDMSRFFPIPDALIKDAFLVENPRFGFILCAHNKEVLFHVRNLYPDLDTIPWGSQTFFERTAKIISPGEHYFFYELFKTATNPQDETPAILAHRFVSGGRELPFTRVIAVPVSKNMVFIIVIRDDQKTHRLYDPQKLETLRQYLDIWAQEFDRERAVSKFYSEISLQWPVTELSRVCQRPAFSKSPQSCSIQTSLINRTYPQGKPPKNSPLEGNPPAYTRILISWQGMSPRQNQDLIGALFSGDTSFSSAIMDFVEIRMGLYVGGLLPVGWLGIPLSAAKKTKTLLGSLSEATRRVGYQAASLRYISGTFSIFQHWLPDACAFEYKTLPQISEYLGEQEDSVVIPFSGIVPAVETIQKRTRANDFYIVDQVNDRGVVVLRECAVAPAENTVWKFLSTRGLKVEDPEPFVNFIARIRKGR